MLPYPKDVIIKAYLYEIAHQHNPVLIELMKSILPLIADYQEGVGDTIRLVDPSNPINNKSAQELAEAFLNQHSLYQPFADKIEAERLAIEAAIQKIEVPPLAS